MVNLPMPARSSGAAVREAVERTWLPRLHAFKPAMIFVSAGFDAHREDDLGNMGLVEDDYAWLTAQICDMANRYAQAGSSAVWRAGTTCRRWAAARLRMCARLPASDRPLTQRARREMRPLR